MLISNMKTYENTQHTGKSKYTSHLENTNPVI